MRTEERWLLRAPTASEPLRTVEQLLAGVSAPGDRYELLAWSTSLGTSLVVQLEPLERALAARGISTKVFLLEATGGLGDAATLRRLASGVIVESGPIGGVVGAMRLGRRHGRRVLAFEVGAGGTRIAIEPEDGWDMEPLTVGPGAAAFQAPTDVAATLHEVAAGVWRELGARGAAPRDLTLVAYGAVAPAHAAALADVLGMTRVLVPPAPAHFGAAGILMADARYDATQGWIGDVPETGDAVPGLDDQIGLVRDGLRDVVSALLGPQDELHFDDYAYLRRPESRRTAKVRLRTETVSEVETLDLGSFFSALKAGDEPAPRKGPVPLTPALLRDAFSRVLGQGVSTGAVEVVAVGSSCRVPLGVTLARALGNRGRKPGEFPGPLRVEEDGAVTLVPEGWRARIHDDGCLEMSRI